MSEILLIPGPTPVPPAVLKAMDAQMINHRSAEFTALAKECHEGLQWIFQTQNHVIIMPCAGTGGLETAVVNLVSPGDHVLACTIGAFGDRFAKAAEAYGCKVEKMEEPWGRAIDPQKLAARLAEDKQGSIKLILVTHNETSTGITNPLKEIAAVCRNHPALLAVDAVSSLGAIDLKTDEWGIDVVVTGSQKALMCPPGFCAISVNGRAWEACEKSKMPRLYFDWRGYKKQIAKLHTPYTPAVSLYYALAASLKLIREEGLEKAFARHARVARICREGVKELGLELFADPNHFSDTVTAVKAPSGVDPAELRKAVRQKGFVLAGGQGHLVDQIFRIGHLGYISEADVRSGLKAIGEALAQIRG